MITLRAGLFDIDGSLCPQGGFIHPAVAAILKAMWLMEFPMGVGTGKNADYARGLAVGMGFQWNHISAEAGAQFLYLKNPGPPPTWEQRKNLAIGIEDLARFCEIIKLNPLRRTFALRNAIVPYRPELKEGIVTLFPPDDQIEATQRWLTYFEELSQVHELQFKRFSDGCIDVMPFGINKRLGVEKVCKIYSCKPEEILTVVDGANDEELILGTTGIAVENANPRIKEIVRNQGGFFATLPDGFGFAQGVLHYARKGLFGGKSEAIVKLVLENIPQADKKKRRK